MKMKSFISLLPGIIIVSAISVIAAILFTASINNESSQGALDFNRIESLSITSTSTTSALPVLVLDKKSDRTYASIVNDSDTVIYLYPGNFSAVGSSTAANMASTTVAVNTGIRLAASGGSFEISNKNLYLGQIWATSTAASKKLIIIEK